MRFLTGTTVGVSECRSGGRDGRSRRRLGSESERREEPAHGVELRHRPEDPPRAAARPRGRQGGDPASEGAPLSRDSDGPTPLVEWGARREGDAAGTNLPGGRHQFRPPERVLPQDAACVRPSISRDLGMALLLAARAPSADHPPDSTLRSRVVSPRATSLSVVATTRRRSPHSPPVKPIAPPGGLDGQ
jgi:hypothetical protein